MSSEAQDSSGVTVYDYAIECVEHNLGDTLDKMKQKVANVLAKYRLDGWMVDHAYLDSSDNQWLLFFRPPV